MLGSELIIEIKPTASNFIMEKNRTYQTEK
jgi:hypothetical protein